MRARAVIEESLPDDLDLTTVEEVHPAVYALPHSLDFTLDEATPIIGLLAKIDCCIALIELSRSPKR